LDIWLFLFLDISVSIIFSGLGSYIRESGNFYRRFHQGVTGHKEKSTGFAGLASCVFVIQNLLVFPYQHLLAFTPPPWTAAVKD
jgi:hypothetical protein